MDEKYILNLRVSPNDSKIKRNNNKSKYYDDGKTNYKSVTECFYQLFNEDVTISTKISDKLQIDQKAMSQITYGMIANDSIIPNDIKEEVHNLEICWSALRFKIIQFYVKYFTINVVVENRVEYSFASGSSDDAKWCLSHVFALERLLQDKYDSLYMKEKALQSLIASVAGIIIAVIGLGISIYSLTK